MNNTDALTSKALELMDELARIEAILTVTAEMDGLDKSVAVTLSHVTIDLIPQAEKIVFSLIEDSDSYSMQKSKPALTA